MWLQELILRVQLFTAILRVESCPPTSPHPARVQASSLSDPGLRNPRSQNHPWMCHTAWHKSSTAPCCSLAALGTLVWVSTARPQGLRGQNPWYSLPSSLTDLTGVAGTDKHPGHHYIFQGFDLRFNSKVPTLFGQQNTTVCFCPWFNLRKYLFATELLSQLLPIVF